MKAIKFTDEQLDVLRYIVRVVQDNMSFDDSMDEYTDGGGIVLCMDEDEYKALMSINPSELL